MGLPKRFYLISGTILWISPFILALISKTNNLKYTIVLIIAGTMFFARYLIENPIESKKKNMEKTDE